jgi:hypothetical protein
MVFLVPPWFLSTRNVEYYWYSSSEAQAAQPHRTEPFSPLGWNIAANHLIQPELILRLLLRLPRIYLPRKKTNSIDIGQSMLYLTCIL